MECQVHQFMSWDAAGREYAYKMVCPFNIDELTLSNLFASLHELIMQRLRSVGNPEAEPHRLAAGYHGNFNLRKVCLRKFLVKKGAMRFASHCTHDCRIPTKTCRPIHRDN